MLVIVLAKSPVPGRVKTRLVPAFTPEEAAELAAAALADTLSTACRCGADEVVVALDGDPGPWLPTGCRLVAQRGHGLDERLAAAWHDAGSGGVQIGMDTPQLRASELDDALAMLASHDAALGPAVDGGWWGIALRRPDARVFLGVPMSRADTAVRQRIRMDELGLATAVLPVRRDVDRAEDVPLVAAAAPDSQFAVVAERLGRARAH